MSMLKKVSILLHWTHVICISLIIRLRFLTLRLGRILIDFVLQTHKQYRPTYTQTLCVQITRPILLVYFLIVFRVLLGSHTYSVKAFCSGRRICRLPSVCLPSVVCPSVPRQISETTPDLLKISLPLQEIGVAEQEYDVRFCTGSS